MRVAKILFAAMSVLAIVGGTVALWLGDWPRDAKIKLTLLNALGWAAILLPAIAVSRWARQFHRPDGR